MTFETHLRTRIDYDFDPKNSSTSYAFQWRSVCLTQLRVIVAAIVLPISYRSRSIFNTSLQTLGSFKSTFVRQGFLYAGREVTWHGLSEQSLKLKRQARADMHTSGYKAEEGFVKLHARGSCIERWCVRKSGS